ncbi:MAG: DUF1385 domain-containing protein [Lachnospiraceae bacterium]|nr:DUF1385 domain-containing protein [Lachnospiraceae bacterium]
MKFSGIGGQAVMEGVMMRNGKDYAIAVRLNDGSIHVDKKKTKGQDGIWYRIPIIRGICNFISSFVIGMSTLMDSAAYFEEENPKNLTEEEKKKKEKRDKVEMTGTVIFSVVLALVIFLLIPYYFSRIVGRWVDSKTLMAFLEGVLRIVIFVIYIKAISCMEDIRRVFMYHGAEHKCINCIEHGLPLTVENVRKSSRQHKRCGTSFLLFVLVISMVVFMFIRFDAAWMQLLCRLLLVPLIAGVSYEFIRLAGRSENAVVQIFSKPGLWLQKLTTSEPDDAMIEVGMASVEAVFDWKTFQEENKECFHEV